MTPFQQLRVWFRRASSGDRAGSVIAIAIVTALTGWLIMPVTNNQEGSSTVLSFGDAPHGNANADPLSPTGQPVAPEGTRPQPTTPASAPTNGSGGPTVESGNTVQPGRTTAPGPSARSSGGSTCPAGVDQGASATTIQVAATLIDIGGAAGNQTLGVPSPAEQQQLWQIVADDVNATGGAGCRKLALKFYKVNPLDANDAQQKCLQIAADKPFLTVDTGSLTVAGASDCLVQQHIPLVGLGLSKNQLLKYYPYYLTPYDIADNYLRNGILVFKKLGFFSSSKGFGKLGFLYHSCLPEYPRIARAAMREAGLPSSQIVEYDLGCPAGGQDTPASFSQAVLTFKNANVTHVTEVQVFNIASFSTVAQQQNFKPRYILADDYVTGQSSGTNGPDPDQFNGAVNITNERYGEQTTPGYRPSAATQRCNAIMAKHGKPQVYEQAAGYGGFTCDVLWFVREMMRHTPQVQRTALVRGLHSIGKLDLSYPPGPVDFGATPANAPYARVMWRVVTFFKSCKCWKVTDPTFHPQLI